MVSNWAFLGGYEGLKYSSTGSAGLADVQEDQLRPWTSHYQQASKGRNEESPGVQQSASLIFFGTIMIRLRYTTDIARDNAAKLQSVTQEKDLDAFLNTAQLAAKDFTAEKQNVKIVHTPTVGPSVNQNPFLLSSEEEKDALRKHWEYRTQLRVPRRPPWTKTMTPAQLDRQEKDSILGWRRNLAVLQEKENLLLTPFERNLEVWRQLWRVVERSHLIVQIVDARNPLRFRCADLDDYVRDVEGPEGEKGTGAGLRKSLLLINKSDLLDQEQRRQWADYFDSQDIQYAFFSALDAKILQEARLATLEGGSVAAPPAEVVQDVRNKDAFTTSSDGLEDDKL
ncbi:hypothetical protein FRB99_003937, partial [Tulasnella sp. 403]